MTITGDRDRFYQYEMRKVTAWKDDVPSGNRVPSEVVCCVRWLDHDGLIEFSKNGWSVYASYYGAAMVRSADGRWISVESPFTERS